MVIFFLISRVFLFMPFYTLWVTHQDFAKWENLWRYTHTHTHTHTHTYIYIYIYIFFSYIYFNYLVRLPLIFFDLAEILTRGSPIRQTHCLKNSSKFWKLAEMEHTEIYVFCWFLGPIYCRVIPGHVMQA